MIFVLLEEHIAALFWYDEMNYHSIFNLRNFIWYQSAAEIPPIKKRKNRDAKILAVIFLLFDLFDSDLTINYHINQIIKKLKPKFLQVDSNY